MRKGAVRDALSKKCRQLAPAITLFPTDLQKISGTVPEVVPHGGVVGLVEPDKAIPPAGRHGGAVDPLPIGQRSGSLGMLADASEPRLRVLPPRQDEPGSGIAPVDLTKQERPRKIINALVARRNLEQVRSTFEAL